MSGSDLHSAEYRTLYQMILAERNRGRSSGGSMFKVVRLFTDPPYTPTGENGDFGDDDHYAGFTYTVSPSGRVLHVTLVGGGGGGGGAQGATGEVAIATGGASGCWMDGWLNVTPGQVLNGGQGIKGRGGAAGVDGERGGYSWFDGIGIAYGGERGSAYPSGTTFLAKPGNLSSENCERNMLATHAIRFNGTDAVASQGGSTPWGRGGIYRFDGPDWNVYEESVAWLGGGGAGAVSNSAVGNPGTDGADGWVFVDEYLFGPLPAIPVPPGPTYGPDLLTNGGFDGDASGWTLDANWAYSSGGIVHTPGSGDFATQNPMGGGDAIVARIYRVTITLSGYISGAVTPVVGGNGLGGGAAANGVTEILLDAYDTSGFYLWDEDGSFEGKVESVTVQLQDLP